MQKEKFNPSGNGQENFEDKFREVVCPLDLLREQGFHLLECLQEKEREVSPENFIGMNLRPLENPDCPNVLVMMPHSGEHAPKNLYDRLTLEGKKQDAGKVDAGTMFIGQSEKIASMWPKIARFCGFDLNRRPFTQDEFSPSPEALSSGSFMWGKTRTGFPMYKSGGEPTDEEKMYFSKEYHDKYYKSMLEIADTLVAKNENQKARILAIDLHSYPEADPNNKDMAEAWKSFLSKEELKEFYLNAPLFILSDGKGLSCDIDIKNALAEALKSNVDTYLTKEERSLLFANIPSQKTVDTDKYLTGAYNVEFGDKQRKSGLSQLNVIQIEMNESSYVDFHGNICDAAYNKEKLEIMRKLLEKSILDIDPVLKAVVET